MRFYRDHGTNMYVCFLDAEDASKAFDRVDYTVLFRKLMTRGVPVYILRLLWNWLPIILQESCGLVSFLIVLPFVMVLDKVAFCPLFIWNLY